MPRSGLLLGLLLGCAVSVFGAAFIKVDNAALPARGIRALRSFFTDSEIPWRYIKTGYSPSEVCDGATPQWPWIASVNPDRFSQAPLWKKVLKTKMEELIGGEELFVMEVTGHYVQFGDILCTCNTSSDETGRDVNAVVFLEPKWAKNWYGELVFFDASRSNVVSSVYPRPGRMVVWDANVPFLLRPPSSVHRAMALVMMVRASKSESVALEARRDEVAKQEEFFDQERLSRDGFANLPTTGATEAFAGGTAEIESLVTWQMGKAGSRHRLAVFDGALGEAELESMQEYMTKWHRWSSDTDITETDDSDNVKWLGGPGVTGFMSTALYRRLTSLVRWIGDPAKRDKWFAYDVSINLMRTFDDPHLHYDCNNQEDQWTLLMYLTPNMSQPTYGETMFYAPTKATTNPDDFETFEIVTGVTPKYSRIALFHCSILHSARPPSPAYAAARFSLAVKFSASQDEVDRIKEQDDAEDRLLGKIT